MEKTRPSLLPGLAAVGAGAVFAVALLTAEQQWAVGALIAGAALASLAAWRFGLARAIGASVDAHEGVLNAAVIAAVLAVTAWFYEDHFPLLMMATVLLSATTCIGLTVQFGYAGMVNFAGASFYGVGAYTAAVVVKYTAVPHLLAIPLGGLAAAALGSLLILPMLRTKGHYTAVVTIAFAILMKTFLEVNDTLGGPQGMKIRNVTVFGWKPNTALEFGGVELSHYVVYVVAALALLVLAFGLTRRMERSWVGLALDTVRIDETAAACFGHDIARWKIVAFTWGNALAGMAGALYALMVGFIAPNNFTFGDSLILVSIILLGGIGNLWGAMLAAALVVILPEKFQIIQEYRFLLYAGLVMLILLFRPQGLLPRTLRAYVPGRA
ncbi:MAG TPA: branched-chain amino acid ABC transporter permease [Azospirillum sp.]|nr:branched-chain amino acid ABC transporter permease [Azospirillum sp.]